MATKIRTPHPSNRVRIYTLLCKGFARKDICRQLNVSEARVREITSFFEGNGLIKRICKYPAIYARNEKIRTPHVLVPDTQCYAYILPHHVGADYRLFKPLPKAIYKNGIFVIETRTFTATFRQKTVSIWMHHFRGESPDEVLKNAETDLDALALSFGQKYNTKLSKIRLIPYIEWADTDEERSQKICAEGGIAKRDWKIVDRVRHKNTDGSDDTLQIEPAPGEPVARPILHARRHHDLYSGEYERRIESQDARLDKVITAIEKLTEVLQEVKAWKDLQEAKK